MGFWKRLFGRNDTQAESGSLTCQNPDCAERYDLEHIVTVDDDDVMSMLRGGGAVVIGQMSGGPVMVGHTDRRTGTSDLNKFLNNGPRLGWQCGKCKKKNDWTASFKNAAGGLPQRGLSLRNAKLRYFTGTESAAWGDGHQTSFAPSKWEPKLPASCLQYLLDGKLYKVSGEATSEALRKLVIQNINDAAQALRKGQGSTSEEEAAILTVMKLKLSMAVQNAEEWDIAEARVDRIIRGS